MFFTAREKTRRLVASTYAALPPGTAIVDPALEIDAATSGLGLDVGSVPVSGNVTVNGARPTTGSDCASCPDCSKASVTFFSEAVGSFSTAIPCSSSAYASRGPPKGRRARTPHEGRRKVRTSGRACPCGRLL
jgi:hypothetical protein